MDPSFISVLRLGHRHVINNKKLTQAVLAGHSRHKDRIEKSSLGVVRFFTAVRTPKHENSVRHLRCEAQHIVPSLVLEFDISRMLRRDCPVQPRFAIEARTPRLQALSPPVRRSRANATKGRNASNLQWRTTLKPLPERP